MCPMPGETEVAIIGSGAAGLSAALTAAEVGARVMVFEKQRSLGGTANFIQGIFAVESGMQRKEYITYSRDEAFKAIMEYSHWRANPRLVRAIVNESAATISWLQDQGVEFTAITINMPNAPRTYHVLKGRGEPAMKALASRAKEKGVDIRPGVPVKRLIRQGERVVGLVVEEDGEERLVKANAAVISAGGYANNKDWIKRYTGFDLGENIIPVGNVDKMGDGIRMAWEAGAAEEGLGLLEVNRVGPLGPEFAMACHLELAASQPDLWVNARGERFCDESIGFYDTPVGNASARNREGYTFSLFDDSIKKLMLENGIERNVAIENMPGTRPVDLEKEMKAALERGSTEVFAADSVAGLASRLGMKGEVLEETVAEYNRFCAQGHDDLFAKDPRYLRPLQGPRFYAIRAHTIFLGTMGGIKINEKAEVIDKKERVIPGLYAAGFDAGGLYGDSYCMRDASGLSSAFAFNSGRLAGRNALQLIGKI
jgi:succinate dehydrogenase/fumarate reductase flavoprotein subunit